MKQKFLDNHNSFGNFNYAKNYRYNRVIPKSSLKKIIEIIEPLKDRPVTILDIGCGTGFFSEIFSEIFSKTSTIDAIDKSSLMISFFKKNVFNRKIKNINCFDINFFDFNTIKKYDIVFCSEMIHLINDPFSFFQKIYKIMNHEAILIVRTSTHKQLYKRNWYKFFPKCLLIDLKRHKSKYVILSILKQLKFTKIKAVETDESQIISRNKYIEMFQKRCFSTLHLISLNEYNKNLQTLIETLKYKSSIEHDYKMTLYTCIKS